MLERAALPFARTAAAVLIADAVESLTGELFDTVVGAFGLPAADDEQLVAPWACPGCGSVRGFRRRGLRPGGRQIGTAVGRVRLAAGQLACRSCTKRFVPAVELLGLRPYQRTSTRVTDLAAGLAVEVSYAKSAWLASELTGVTISPRQFRRGVLDIAPERITPEVLDVPILLLDPTGLRAGPDKGGVALNLAIGLVTRRREGSRVSVEVRLLGATVDEPWSTMEALLAGVRPGLVVVDGEAIGACRGNLREAGQPTPDPSCAAGLGEVARAPLPSTARCALAAVHRMAWARDSQSVGLACVKMFSVEIVSGAEIGRRLGVSREAVRLWRQRSGFPEPVGRVGRAVAWDWEDVRRWAEEQPKQATDRWGARGG